MNRVTERPADITPELEYTASLFFKIRTAFFVDYSKGIVNPIGSGVFAEIGGKPYVLSSYHVWELGKALGGVIKISSFVLSEAKGGDMMKVWWSPKDSDIIPLKYVNGVEIDLIAIKLEQWVLEKHPEIFLHEKLIDVGPQTEVDTVFHVAGYPTAFYRPSTENIAENPNRTTLVVYGTVFQSKENWNPAYSPDYHYVLEYPDQMAVLGRENFAAPDPEGMSGCGIWAMTKTGDGLWVAEKKLKLIGIQFEWLRKSRVLIGGQIKYLIDEIKKGQPI